MGVFDFFFFSSKDTSSSSSSSSSVLVSHSKPGSETVKYDAKGAPIFKDNKVLAINDNKDDDFIQVDIRKLSYAEVAALSAAKNSCSSNNNKKPSTKDNMKVVDVNQDLGTDITDYQLAEAIQKQIDARDLKEAIAAQQNRFIQSGASNDDLMDFADKFDTKIASSKQTRKHKKHSRKDKIKLAQHTFINL